MEQGAQKLWEESWWVSQGLGGACGGSQGLLLLPH